MEEKARLYAAMKRGDVEDVEERFAVDFDQKWAEKYGEGEEEVSDDEDAGSEEDVEVVEYTDEFGRTRTGTRADAARESRVQRSRAELESDRFTARPTAPSNIIRGDTVQHRAFNPDEPIAVQMEALASKRDKSLTPPPEEHFDGSKEVRSKGTGFFQFSEDGEERRRQMEGLEGERVETERARREREGRVEERKRKVEERRREILNRRGKRKADDFLEELGVELGSRTMGTSVEETEGLEKVVR